MCRVDLERILFSVRKPSRYINSEINSIHKKMKNETVKICLCFPDLIELGSSNLGIEILYHIINSRNDSLAERVHSVDLDLEEILRKENIELFSLESQTPIRDFDIVGFSLQYELSYTNVLNILDLAKIPIYSKDREVPLVIAGGPACCNPEPMSDFIDFFVLGEGEEVINEIIEKFKLLKKKRAKKDEILFELSKIEGVYVPSFYNIRYYNGKIKEIVPKFEHIRKVKKRTVNLQNAYFPTRPIIPYIQSVHNKLNVEISRGCIHRCKFCQATNIYNPWRERSEDKVVEIVKEGVKNTGYDDVSLLSFSATSHTKLVGIIKEIRKIFSDGISVSIPSIRCDEFTYELAETISYPKKSGLTFAIEAATERLRKVIGKPISTEKILESLQLAAKFNWRLIKLYFMVSLPTETDDDLESIIILIKKIRETVKSIKLNVTISPFVPKPHTPFQWHKFQKIEELNEKLKKIKKYLKGVSLKIHKPEMSHIESTLARGDRRLSKVIENAFKNGCKFDQWRERFFYEKWIKAFKDIGLEPEVYNNYSYDDILPWENISYGADKLQV